MKRDYGDPVASPGFSSVERMMRPELYDRVLRDTDENVVVLNPGDDLQAAVTSATAGMTFVLRPGTYGTGAMTWTLSGENVRITGTNALIYGNLHIDGDGTILDGLHVNGSVTVDESDCQLIDLTFDGNLDSAATVPIIITTNGMSTVVQNCRMGYLDVPPAILGVQSKGLGCIFVGNDFSMVQTAMRVEVDSGTVLHGNAGVIVQEVSGAI